MQNSATDTADRHVDRIELMVRTGFFKPEGAFPVSAGMTPLAFYHIYAKHWLSRHDVLEKVERRLGHDVLRFVLHFSEGGVVLPDRHAALFRNVLPTQPESMASSDVDKQIRPGRPIEKADFDRFCHDLEADPLGMTLSIWFGDLPVVPCPACHRGGSRVDRSGETYICNMCGVLTPERLLRATLYDDIPPVLKKRKSRKK